MHLSVSVSAISAAGLLARHKFNATTILNWDVICLSTKIGIAVSRYKDENKAFTWTIRTMIIPHIARSLAFSSAVLLPSLPSRASENRSCRILPSDDAWPDHYVWDAFNTSVDGRLIKVVPDGSPCHDPGYDEDLCKVVRENWFVSQFHSGRPGSIMNSVFYNQSCDPFTSREVPCMMKNVVEYSVNVSRVEHIIKAVQFVKEYNIRFVVKNTGHDYMGKSTGTGALSVWMHHLQDIEWVPDYVSAGYTGPAVKAPAGVIGADLAAFAGTRGYAVVSGQCPTVGFTGGYVQGGGHSIISSAYGLAADQTLEFEVVTMQGEHLVASPTQNEDLYWALSGGGGGTYAVVLSVTTKVFPDVPLTLAFLNFSGIPSEVYWKANPTMPSYQMSRALRPPSYRSTSMGPF
ncbi:hypothetical protein PM082_012097 [Marasmius tenuissimus]|nr:hypothetical protein PM082_012097 [Marasmius tenuissimus]